MVGQIFSPMLAKSKKELFLTKKGEQSSGGDLSPNIGLSIMRIVECSD